MISNKISGWYYDLQLENKLTCASLHPSKVLASGGSNKEGESNSSDKSNSNNGGEKKGDDEKDWVGITNKDDQDPDIGLYRKDPICRAIITEDFNVSVANSWSEFGNDMIGSMWNNIKPLAPYAGHAINSMAEAVKQYKDMKTRDPEGYKKIQESSISRAMAAMLERVTNGAKELNITEYLNRSLVVQGTRFSYYSGTGTSFGNMMMKFTLFPTFDKKTDKYLTVNEQVNEIIPYCMGEFISGSHGLKFDDKNEKDQEDKNLIDGLIGWQRPPGGFASYFKDVDVEQPGTLMLRFGAYYCITNLVIENATFNFSKQMAKNPTPGAKDLISPLYCEVTLQLRPATKFSDKSLRKFVSSRNSTTLVKELSEEMKNNLSSNDYDVY